MSGNSFSFGDAMMLDDDEGDELFSDDDEGNAFGGGSLGDKNIPSAADRRAHHNALERKRRDHIKDSFTSLRDSVPSLQGEKVTASRAQILKKAAEYIQFMRKKNTNVQADIDEIAKQNKMLEEQIRRMEMQRTGGTGGGMTNKALSPLFSTNESTDVSPSYDISENSNASSNSGLGSSSMVAGATSPPAATGSSIATAVTTAVPAVSIINGLVDGGNSNNLIKNSTGRVLNGTLTANTLSVRPLTVKNGTGKIIVQNPQHKNTPHVIHVITTPGTGTVTANGTTASNITAMSSTGTPIIISTSRYLPAPNQSSHQQHLPT